MTALATAKTLLGPDADNALVEAAHGLSQALLLTRLRSYNPEQLEVPPDLQHVLAELTVARYNRIGSEGLKSEAIEGRSATYQDDTLQAYAGEIEAWAIKEHFWIATGKPQVRFL